MQQLVVDGCQHYVGDVQQHAREGLDTHTWVVAVQHYMGQMEHEAQHNKHHLDRGEVSFAEHSEVDECLG